MRMLTAVLLWLSAVVLPLAAARAHDGLPVVVTIEQRAADLYLMRLILPPSVPEFVRPAFSVEPGCRTVRNTPAAGPPTAEAVLYRCPEGIGGGELRLRYPGGKPAVPTLARIVWQSGEVRSVLAEPGATELRLPAPESARGVLRDYFALGVQHILEGWDHLLFLLCLLLIARTPRRILLTVTGFTLGHALTITAVSLGVAAMEDPRAGLDGLAVPGLARSEPKTLFTPATVSDRTDGQITHLDGLNLCRAWCWRSLAAALPAGDPRKPTLDAAAKTHLEAALPHVSGDYMGEHWLATFAMLAMTE